MPYTVYIIMAFLVLIVLIALLYMEVNTLKKKTYDPYDPTTNNEQVIIAMQQQISALINPLVLQMQRNRADIHQLQERMNTIPSSSS